MTLGSSEILKRMGRFIKRFIVATTVVSAVFVVTQDFQIFPAVLDSYLLNYKNSPPAGIEALHTHSADGHEVLIWRLRAEGGERKKVALFFHGNGEHIQSTVPLQQWLQSLGFTTYAVEYRGYNGRDSGWPTESGFYQDADAAFAFLSAEEKVEPRDVLVYGNSIGTGTAAYVAQAHQVGTLVLTAPYSSLPTLVQSLPFFGYLSRFLKYDFPVAEFVGKLGTTCVVVAHGQQDGTIPYSHSKTIEASYHGTGGFELITVDVAGHNDIFNLAKVQLEKGIEQCVSR